MTPRKILKHLASLKFAVIIILAIAALVAWGTIVEAIYNDAKMAQERVYHSPLSYSIFLLFAINLTAVIFDRYPWKRHHVGFISAHVGILILIFGSILTRYYGIDGSATIEIGGSESRVTLPETDIIIYTSLDGDSYKKLYDQEVNFLRSEPTEKKPLVFSLPAGDLKIVEFYPYALIENKVEESTEESDGPAVRFQIANDRITQSDWLMSKMGQPSEMALGPAKVVLAPEYKYQGGNVLWFRPHSEDSVEYSVFSDRQKGLIKKGQAKAGDQLSLGWMNLELRVLKYLPKAKQQVNFKKRDKASPETISALKVLFNGQERWVGVNSILRLFGQSEMYVLSYGNRRRDLGFQLQLKDFRVGRYQGTMRAASYESLVYLPDTQKEVLISMNEPLDHKHYTFYQASFQEDETGRPVASVLSVNFDPGRWWKYLGSFLIVFGAIHLFYRRWKMAKGKANETRSVVNA